MHIILTGKAGSGKDTIADYLISKYGYTKISLASSLKRLVQDVFVLTDFQTHDRTERERTLPEWGDGTWSVRKLLQHIGTELFRNTIDREIWVKSLVKRISIGNSKYVVNDCRFENELTYFKNHLSNCKSIRVNRPEYMGDVGIKGHESESYNLSTDYIIENDSTIEDLHYKIDNLICSKIN